MSLIKSLRYNPFTNQMHQKVLTEYYIIGYLEEINAYGVKLNEAPLYGTSVTVSRVSDGFLFTEVSHSTNPQQGEFRVDYYNINNDTINLGTGYIEFNSADAGTEVMITYTGIGEYGDAFNPYYNYYSNLFNYSETNNQLIAVAILYDFFGSYDYKVVNVRIPPKIVNLGNIMLKNKGVYFFEIKIYDLKIEGEKSLGGGAISKELYGTPANGIAYFDYNPVAFGKVDQKYFKNIKIKFLSLYHEIDIPLIFVPAQSPNYAYAYADEVILRKTITLYDAGLNLPLDLEFMQSGIFTTESSGNYPFFISAHLHLYDLSQQPHYGALTFKFKMQIRVDKVL